jgi:hypothetical protein
MSILFCTPCYGGMVTAAHFNSCLKLKAELMTSGVDHGWLTGTNESLVTRARNEMTAGFLKSEFSHMMWLDSDIEFTPEDVAAVWNMEADIGVGVYAMKRPDKQWFAAWKDGALVKDLDQYSGPIEVDYAGTGFMLIKREVIETLAKTAETYEGPDGRVPALYMTPIHNDGFESEDYHFCRKAREAGFKVMMDPKVRLGHIGQYRYGSPH